MPRVEPNSARSSESFRPACPATSARPICSKRRSDSSAMKASIALSRLEAGPAEAGLESGEGGFGGRAMEVSLGSGDPIDLWLAGDPFQSGSYETPPSVSRVRASAGQPPQ